MLAAGIKIMYGAYAFGLSDTIDHLPIIYRYIDSSYLMNDFRVNVSELFGPRYYYSHFVAFLGKAVPLPIVFVSMAFIINVIIAAATYSMTSSIFKGSRFAPLLATTAVMTVNPFHGMGWLVLYYLKPAFLTRAIVYVSLWAAIKKRIVLSISLACLSAFFHPTLGLEAAAFYLLFTGARTLLDYKQHPLIGFKKIYAVFRPHLIAAAILIVYVSLFWVMPYKISLIDTKLATEKFLEIILFRTERTTVPSTFSPSFYYGAIGFLLVFACAWILWYKQESTDKNMALSLLILIVSILLFCLGGYIFIEIYPTRIWVAARAFRMLFLVKLIGLIIMSGVVARLKNWILSVVGFLIFTFICAAFGRTEVVPFLLFLVVFGWFLLSGRLKKRWIRNSVPITILFLFVFESFFHFISPGKPGGYRPRIRYTSSLAKVDGDGVADFARKHTEENAIFLTPPVFGGFRLTAERAIIVDWKSMPFQDSGLLEWWNRMNFCYGDLSGLSRNAGLEKMKQNYRNISTEDIRNISEKYDADYAVLYHNTKIDLPVIYQDEHFKLVKIYR